MTTNTDLWVAITSLPRPSVVVDFPRNDPETGKPVGQLRIWVLTQEEQMESSANAEQFTKKLLKDAPKNDEARRGYDDIYSNSAALEILFRACRRVDDVTKQLFPTIQEVRKYLSMDEVGVLMSHYLTAQTELGPIVARLSEEEVDAWIRRLGEGGSIFPLDLLSWDALKDLAFSLACRIHSLPTATSSPGSPLEDAPISPSPSEATPEV